MKAVELFNSGRFAEFQDALDSMTSSTRASSERQFYTLLKNVAEALLQLSDGDVEDAEGDGGLRPAQDGRVHAALPRPQRRRPARGHAAPARRAARVARGTPRRARALTLAPSPDPAGVTAPRARLVVFDLDGTLIDSSRDLATAVNRALRRVAPAAPALPEDVVRSFVGSGARILITEEPRPRRAPAPGGGGPSRLPRGVLTVPPRRHPSLPGDGGGARPAERPPAGRLDQQARRHEPHHPRRARRGRPVLPHLRGGGPRDAEARSGGLAPNRRRGGRRRPAHR